MTCNIYWTMSPSQPWMTRFPSKSGVASRNGRMRPHPHPRARDPSHVMRRWTASLISSARARRRARRSVISRPSRVRLFNRVRRPVYRGWYWLRPARAPAKQQATSPRHPSGRRKMAALCGFQLTRATFRSRLSVNSMRFFLIVSCDGEKSSFAKGGKITFVFSIMKTASMFSPPDRTDPPHPWVYCLHWSHGGPQ